MFLHKIYSGTVAYQLFMALDFSDNTDGVGSEEAPISQADVRPTMAKASPERAGQSPATFQKVLSKKLGEKHNEMETPAASCMADTRPTMAPAIPCGAGQSPQHGQRRRSSSAEESARQTDTRVSSTQRVPERAATSQADLSPTMAEAIPARAGQSPSDAIQGLRRRQNERYKDSDSTAASSEATKSNCTRLLEAKSQADIRPTMAQAIPERAGQSPGQGQRRQLGEERTRLLGDEFEAATIQADLSPTMAEAIPARAGQSPSDAIQGLRRRQNERYKDSDSTAASSEATKSNCTRLLEAKSQADIRPTMAQAIPERAGQSPGQGQRRQLAATATAASAACYERQGKLIRAELNLHQMGLTSQVSAPENLANSGDRSVLRSSKHDSLQQQQAACSSSDSTQHAAATCTVAGPAASTTAAGAEHAAAASATAAGTVASATACSSSSSSSSSKQRGSSLWRRALASGPGGQR